MVFDERRTGMPRNHFAPGDRGGVTEDEVREAGACRTNHRWGDPERMGELACPRRMLTAILFTFTDVVGSTAQAVALGDRGWAALLERHHRSVVSTMRGTAVSRPTPQAAASSRGSMDPPAIAVHIAVRVASLAALAALAALGEVLVADPVREIVAGSELRFGDRGIVEPKGIPGEWHLDAVADATA